jgi:hypothetical protein
MLSLQDKYYAIYIYKWKPEDWSRGIELYKSIHQLTTKFMLKLPEISRTIYNLNSTMHMVARDKIIRYVTPLFVNVILQ